MLDDPVLDWCYQNKTYIFEKFPDSYIAIDFEKREILVSEKTDIEFETKLLDLDPEKRRKLYTTHTSTLK